MREVGVIATSLVLEHVPDLVRYGSKPAREPEQFAMVESRLRSFDDAVAYPPNQVFIGNLSPAALWDLPRPWWEHRNGASREGRDGEIIDQRSFYDLLAELDQFELIDIGADPDAERGDLALVDGKTAVGAFHGDHDVDESLSSTVLLENLAAKASAVHAVNALRARFDLDPDAITCVIGAGEEAVGDRYQRGGGGLGKAVAEASGFRNASGVDVKAFCAGPVHALITAGALVASDVHESILVVAGGSLAKLGMKFVGAISSDGPVLEDVLAGMAVLVGPVRAGAPKIRLDAVGGHTVKAGHSQQALLDELVSRPLSRVGKRLTDIDVYSTELHNPEVTEPSGGGNVPDRNYRMLAALGASLGQLPKDEIATFARVRGLPGFSPTQGHIASAVPWLPHALERFRTEDIQTTMLMAKGSLFLGRLTHLWDGASIILEA